MLGNLSDIDLRLLRTFCTIVEAGGFTAAQVRLNTSLSRLSVLVRDLELRLGYSLCRRGASGFQLTEEGQQLYEAALELFVDIERFREQANGLGGRDREVLHLGCVDGVLGQQCWPMPLAIRLFRERYPRVRLNLHTQRPDELENAVLEERLQLAIGAFHHRLSGLCYQLLFREEQNLYCSREHPFFSWADDEPSLEAICAAEYVGRGYMAESRRPHGLVFSRATNAYSMEAIANLLFSGAFIGYLPTHYAAKWVADGHLRAIRPAQLAFVSEFHCVTRQGAEPGEVLGAFLDALARAQSELGSGEPAD
ncbi:LysR family transcriptional regulator [Pseudomonas sp. CAN2814]|uniref:LysR family transcriptional regulator n=1 Tax=Pseudomonas sp. CAN1 TaxID=3046726 RepID=UPI0026493D8E|nr:LysR family transcriptional regulator [Pseudomonas sp. CAN1]MDN6855262.1 LysR family transcriptional regulator [Pseudomonas sp. CAN1]